MKYDTFDNTIVAAKPQSTHANHEFVHNTLQRISAETYSEKTRITKVIKKESFIMKLHTSLRHLPAFALLLIIAVVVLSISSISYAAYSWMYPQVTITNTMPSNDEGKKQYAISSQCGENFSQQNMQYELAKNATLDDTQIAKIFNDTCSYIALGDFIDKNWQNSATNSNTKPGDTIAIYEHTNSFAGNDKANHIFGLTIGTITVLNDTSVTIESKVYYIDRSIDGKPNDYYPDGKVISRTLPLLPNHTVWNNGEQVERDFIRIGDQVQLVNKVTHEAKYYEDTKQISLGKELDFGVTALIKTDIQTKYVSIGGETIGDISLSKQIAGLVPCQNNEKYLCVGNYANSVMVPVYQTNDQQSIKINRLNKMYELNGRVESISGSLITAQTRGKKMQFTVNVPPSAGASKLQVGDLINVQYVQNRFANHLNVAQKHIQSVYILGQTQPDGSIAKY